ncbi:MAG: twin-arginine translocation signal domain-containing protein, partial [bacterium]|nr:twin-arginine translocation signal domain-containing protein [bacterium]
MKRRDFLKASIGGTAAALTGGSASARPNLEPVPEAVGMLYDSTLCVGCKACVAKCKEVNGMPPSLRGSDVQFDSALDLSAQTLNVIKVYRDGDAAMKDRAENGFAFEKRSCMHCVDPGCISACPVTALKRHPRTGIVSYDADVCIG